MAQSRRESRGDTHSRERENTSEEANAFIEQVVKIYRVAKVVKGGRNFRFSAIVVVGDGKGKIGAGKGKAREVPDAIRKAIDKAKRNMISVPIVHTTVPHEVLGRADAASVMLKPASLGTGVIAGAPVRAVLEAAGYHNILSKSLGSSNATNVVYATMDALKQLETSQAVAARRGLEERAVL